MHSEVRWIARNYLKVPTLPLFARARTIRDQAFALLTGHQRADQRRAAGRTYAVRPARSHHRFPTPRRRRRSENLKARTLLAETTQEMRDHWWCRPGWRVGRSFYTWHVTFEDQPAAHQFAADYAPVLDDLPTLDPIPVRWLHLTLQGVGFTDEVARADIDAITAAAQHRCTAVASFTITLGPARVDPEALMLPVRPTEPVVALRAAIRAALIDFNRDHSAYEWTDVATAELGAPTT